MHRKLVAALLCLGLSITLGAPPLLAHGDLDDDDRPGFIRGPVSCTTHVGVADDLLTAGLGMSGSQLGPAPAI
jgi:hypothetical protein